MPLGYVNDDDARADAGINTVSTESTDIDHPALARFLRQHADQGSTGTLFFRTADGAWGCFGLRDGELTSLLCRGTKGPKALDLILGASHFDVRFDPSQVMGEGGKPPGLAVDELEMALASGMGAARSPGAASPKQSAPGQSAPRRPDPVRSAAQQSQAAGIAETVLAGIRAETADALGPMGPMLFDAFLEQKGTDLAGVLAAATALAPDIGSDDEAQAFLARITARLEQ
jgi:hypothetical protein